MSARTIAVRYFNDHTSAKDEVLKAYYAYHAPHFQLEPKGHHFTNGSRESCCVWCGRSREMVRWDDLPPECQERPADSPVEDVILSEESKAFDLLQRAELHVPALVHRMGMSGKTLAFLYHTHGYDPETVVAIVDVSSVALSAYHAVMEQERGRSRDAQIKTVIEAAQK